MKIRIQYVVALFFSSSSMVSAQMPCSIPGFCSEPNEENLQLDVIDETFIILEPESLNEYPLENTDRRPEVIPGGLGENGREVYIEAYLFNYYKASYNWNSSFLTESRKNGIIAPNIVVFIDNNHPYNFMGVEPLSVTGFFETGKSVISDSGKRVLREIRNTFDVLKSTTIVNNPSNVKPYMVISVNADNNNDSNNPSLTNFNINNDRITEICKVWDDAMDFCRLHTIMINSSDHQPLEYIASESDGQYIESIKRSALSRRIDFFILLR